MRFLLAGIDEAGYGPLLGPLCVGLAVLSVEAPCETTPDLWALLEQGVCRAPGRGGGLDTRGRVAIADSKELKLSNSVRSTHPLVHLERGVMSFLRALHGATPRDDAELFLRLGARPGTHAAYAGEPTVLPISTSAGELAICAARVEGAMAGAAVAVRAVACRTVAEEEFNRIVKVEGSKAAVTIATLTEHLRAVWEIARTEPIETRIGVACDRLGGRTAYAPILEAAIPGCEVDVVEQTEARSKYVVRARDAGGNDRRIGVVFLTEGEQAHLPVALASMTAKLVRELAMLRFNRHWAEVAAAAGLANVRPTAGYVQDGRRWLAEMKPVLTPADRAAVVRIA